MLIVGLLVVSLSPVLAACSASVHVGGSVGNAPAPAATAMHATTKPAAAGKTTYCADVKKATAARPADGPLDRAKMASYAVTLDRVVLSSPATDHPFWTAVAKESHDIAAGGTGNAANAKIGFDNMDKVAKSVMALCNIDISD